MFDVFIIDVLIKTFFRPLLRKQLCRKLGQCDCDPVERSDGWASQMVEANNNPEFTPTIAFAFFGVHAPPDIRVDAGGFSL